MIDCIIFDADHTLYRPRSEEAYQEQFAFLAEQVDIDQERLQQVWQQKLAAVQEDSDPEKRFRKNILRAVLRDCGVDADDAVVDDAYTRFWETVAGNMMADPRINDAVQRLRDMVEVLAIATDEFPEALNRKLEVVFEDRELFDTIVTPRETGTMKPSPRFYQIIMDQHTVEPDTAMMVGDSWEKDLKPAAALGITTVLVTEEAGAGNPDHRVEHVADVQQLVEAHGS